MALLINNVVQDRAEELDTHVRDSVVGDAQEEETPEKGSVFIALGWWLDAQKTGVTGILQGLSLFAAHKPSFSWSSACSGSELYVRCLHQAQSWLQVHMGVSITFKHLVAAENDEGVQRWILEQFTAQEVIYTY